MRVFHPGAYLAAKNVNFLDATEEEVIDLARSLVGELSIAMCFLTLTPEKKKKLRASIANFEAYLACRSSTH